MPAFRNVKTRRSSGRIWNKPAIAYDENGWEIAPRTDRLLKIHTHNDVSSPHSNATSPSIASVDSDFEACPARKTKGKAKVAHPSDSDHVPRPKNAFILFRSYFYQTCGGSDQNQISVNAGKAWKALPDEQKKPFQLAADREKQEHQAKFPHYTYAPGSKLGTVRRKNSAAKKKKTQSSAKKSLVAQPADRDSCRPSCMKAEPTSIIVLPSALPSFMPSSSVSPEAEKPTVELVNNNIPQSEPVFSANWSFATAFVPTSEIPSLELSPVKSEKGENKDRNVKGLKSPSTLRPPNFDISNEPFCLNPDPTTVAGYLDTISVHDFHDDYSNETFEQFRSSSTFALTTSSSELETWSLNNSSNSNLGPLEVIDDNGEFDTSARDDEDLRMDQDFKPSSLPFLTADPVAAQVTSFEYCEMDQYVDYGECGA